ncbi:MAG: cytochrome P460 family protein [Bacteroidetes bacterium]|nr:cytochrome P460 family protein [Bacteroidota bacterium]
MKKYILLSGIVALSVISIQSCKKDKTDPDADNKLYSEATASGFTKYQNDTLLSAASPSPHGSFKLRFNSTAAAALDSTGELPSGNTFPYGSVIVKDVYNGTDLKLYAVMKKDPSSSNSGNGWLWAEFNPDGSVVFSTGKKGDGCVSCHSGSPNRDLTRTFDLH